MATRTLFIGSEYDPVAAGASVTYRALLVDENDVPMGPISIDTLVLSLVDTPSGSIVNNVDQVNILNEGRGTLDAAGNLTVALEPADTALFNPADDLEERSMVFEWTYNGGVKTGFHQVDFEIQALSA